MIKSAIMLKRLAQWLPSILTSVSKKQSFKKPFQLLDRRYPIAGAINFGERLDLVGVY